MEGGADADHVRDRVRGSRLVKVNALDREPVRLGFRFDEAPEDDEGSVPHCGLDLRVGDDLANVGERAAVIVIVAVSVPRAFGVHVMVVVRVPRDPDVDLGRRDGAAYDGVAAQAHAA